jgi:RNA polymerase sigma factor (sigma-70 family)
MINVMSKQETYRKYTPFTIDDAVRDRGAVEYHYFQQDDLSWEDIKASELPNPEELLIRREEIEEAKIILTNVIGALNERENFVLDHRILERDMGLQEIADKFGVSHMAIKRDEERIKKAILVYTSTSKQEQERKN